MKRVTLPLTALLFILAGPMPLIAAEPEQQTVAPKTAHEKEQYEQGMKERLGRVGADLDRLKADAAAGTGKVEGKMKEYLSDAEKKKRVAERKLDELGKASKESWKKFTGGMEKAAKDFEQAFSRAKSRKE
jgi:hypothetical protein